MHRGRTLRGCYFRDRVTGRSHIDFDRDGTGKHRLQDERYPFLAFRMAESLVMAVLQPFLSIWRMRVMLEAFAGTNEADTNHTTVR